MCPGLTAITLSVPEGAYTMATLQDAINHAVNLRLHTEGAALLQDVDGTDDFITLAPDYVANRVVLTFNHDACTLHWSDAAATMGSVIVNPSPNPNRLKVTLHQVSAPMEDVARGRHTRHT
jgi:hypothetical protein